MPVIALYTESKSLLCFLLVAGDESIGTGNPERDCMITGHPTQVEDLKHPLWAMRNAQPDTEYQISVEKNYDGAIKLSINLASDSALTLSIENETGTWNFSTASAERSGVCIAPSKMPD